MPLYLRILLLFFLNAAVLVGAAAWAAHRQMQEGIVSLLGTIVGVNIQQTAEKVYDELVSSPQSEWGAIITKFEQQHGVQCGLFEMPNTHLTGSVPALPEDVAKGMFPKMGGSSGPAMGMRPPRARPDAARDAEDGSPDRPSGNFTPPAHPSNRNPNSKAGPRDFAKGLIHTGSPARYWAVALLPPVFGNNPGPPQRLIFAIVTDSVFTTRVLFDLRPWLIALLSALLLSSLLWLPFVRGITGKLAEMTQATKLMAAGKLTTRIREGRTDEIGQLASAVNLMAGQLDGYVSGQRRFTRDIAHELCSPISRMQAAVGVLDSTTLNDRQLHYINALSDELQHMSHLVEELLQFAKTTHEGSHQFSVIVLEPLIQTVIDREIGQGDESAVSVNVPNDLIVQSDPILLSRALCNVLRNALRYASSGGPIEITAEPKNPKQICICIADHGPGVPPEALPKLFDAFYRPDEARTPDQGGAGLGLAIVKYCVEATGGTVTAHNRPSGGLEIEITQSRQ